mgnify:CR=1 FL=1
MAHALRPNPHQILAKHQENMLASLAHRLEVARATNNSYLLEQLEKEQRQIAGKKNLKSNTHAAASKGNWLDALKAIAAPFVSNNLQVHEFNNGSDHWWYAFDPQSGKWVYADCEAELRLWIRDNYRGK